MYEECSEIKAPAIGAKEGPARDYGAERMRGGDYGAGRYRSRDIRLWYGTGWVEVTRDYGAEQGEGLAVISRCGTSERSVRGDGQLHARGLFEERL